MSRLNDLLRRLETSDPDMARDLKREVDALADRRAFGLNFERHVPEAVELPERPVRKGDKVRILPPRGSKSSAGDERLWRVISSFKDGDGKRVASLELLGGDEAADAAMDDLVVVAEFRDPIYPGLVSTGKVEHGGDKPFHSVINGENHHALQTLLFTHRGKVDCIYIDPPYNTGAKDWKYNNDYVEDDDLYRHSKWLAFMERRLLLAKKLLNLDDSVLIVTIDEKEFLRLGLLLEQTFPEGSLQMITSAISPQGSSRLGGFSRVEEYIYFVRFGRSVVTPTGDDMLTPEDKNALAPVWFSMIRSGTDARREDSKNGFYPIYVDSNSRQVLAVGDPVPHGVPRESVGAPIDAEVVWPIRRDGSEGRWQLTPSTFKQSLEEGFAKIGQMNNTGGRSVMYVRTGDRKRIQNGEITQSGSDEWGYPTYVRLSEGTVLRAPKSMWNRLSHDAGKQGSMLLGRTVGGRKFPFPKSLYAVEDCLRFFVRDKRDAIVLDFFAGSGTTAHAVMRLNRQDDGWRQSISVTNNEVSEEEQLKLRVKSKRPGDEEWERLGICNFITKPRIRAAITGETPEGNPIAGDYKFIDEFPLADGFNENAEFFDLAYEAPLRVSSNREFGRVAPLLWLRAGSRGRRIEDISSGWDVADTYGVLADLNQTARFVRAVAASENVVIAYVITDEDRLFESVVRELPDHVEPLRLYESYLRNFEIETGRSAL